MSFAFPVKHEITPTNAASRRGELRSTVPGQSIRLAALRVPLAVKLVGANLLVITIVGIAWIATGGHLTPLLAVLAVAVVALHLALVLVALRPIRDLEAVAARVWDGDVAARVQRSSLTDDQVLRVGSMFNLLLDELTADRTRMRALASDVIANGERERAALAEELQNSTAQDMAALLLQLSAAARDATDPAFARRLTATRDAAEQILEQIRLLSQTVHPSVLDNLGLEAALRKLARESSRASGVDIDVDAKRGQRRLPPQVNSAFYRVAEEAVRNALRHGDPRQIRITLYTDASSAVLEIHDDGQGFDLGAAADQRAGTGLVTMHERISLLDGWLEIKTAKGNGTTLTATVPLAV